MIDLSARPHAATVAATPTYSAMDDHGRDALYGTFQPLVRRLIAQYGADPELRKDLPGEIYCRFCRLLDDFEPSRGVPLRAYLVRGLTTSVYSFARSRWRARVHECCLDPDLVPLTGGGEADPSDKWVDQMMMREVIRQLPRAIAGLPQRQRQVVIGRYYEGRSSEELAQILGIQPATIRSVMRHALSNLRKRIVFLDPP